MNGMNKSTGIICGSLGDSDDDGNLFVGFKFLVRISMNKNSDYLPVKKMSEQCLACKENLKGVANMAPVTVSREEGHWQISKSPCQWARGSAGSSESTSS